MGTGAVRQDCGDAYVYMLWLIYCSYSNLAEEEVVAVSSLVDGEECYLSNGAKGFLFGRIQLS